MLSQAFSVIIEIFISKPGHIIEVVDGFKAVEKRFLLQLISTVQLPGANIYDTQIVMNTGTSTSDISLARELKTPVYCVTQTWGD